MQEKDERRKRTRMNSFVSKHATLETRSLTRTQFLVHNDTCPITVSLQIVRAFGVAILGTQPYRWLYPISL